MTATANGYKAMPYAANTSKSAFSSIAGLILCGGKSTRMGFDKSELCYHGNPLYKHSRVLLQHAGLHDIYYAGRGNISDIYPERGPLGGIHAALTVIGEHYSALLIIPVDMPLLNITVLKTLINFPGDCQAVYFQNHPLPLRLSTASLVQIRLTSLLEQCIEKISVKNFLTCLKCHALPLPYQAEHGLININTPQDWQRHIGECL